MFSFKHPVFRKPSYWTWLNCKVKLGEAKFCRNENEYAMTVVTGAISKNPRMGLQSFLKQVGGGGNSLPTGLVKMRYRSCFKIYMYFHFLQFFISSNTSCVKLQERNQWLRHSGATNLNSQKEVMTRVDF